MTLREWYRDNADAVNILDYAHVDIRNTSDSPNSYFLKDAEMPIQYALDIFGNLELHQYQIFPGDRSGKLYVILLKSPTSQRSVLQFDKPKKIRSTEENNEMYKADNAPPGVYVPNMSVEDMLKWKAKKVSGQSERVEIRKTISFPEWNAAQMVCVVFKDLENNGPAVKITSNGKLIFSRQEWENFKAGVEEAFKILGEENFHE